MNPNQSGLLCPCLLATGLLVATAAFAGDGDEPPPDRSNSEAFRKGYQAGYDDGFSRGYQKALDERGPAIAPAPTAGAPRAST